MDIKSRNTNGNKLMTAVVFIVCVVMFISALTGGAFFTLQASNSDGAYFGRTDGILIYDSYRESPSFQQDYQQKLENILNLLNQYKSEEYIQSGKTVSEERLEDAIRNLFYSGFYQGAYNNGNAEVVNIGYDVASTYGSDYDTPAVRERFKADYAEEIARIKEIMIRDDLRDFQISKKQLDQPKGFFYYASDKVNVLTNLEVSTASAVTAGQFSSAPAYLIYENSQLKKVPSSKEFSNQNMKSFDRTLDNRLYSEYNEDLKVYFSFDKNYLSEKEASYAAVRAGIIKWLPLAAACMLLSLIALIWLIVTTGRKDETGNRPVRPVDRLFTELQLLIIGFLFVGGGVGFGNFLLGAFRNYDYYGGSYFITEGSPILSGVMAAVIGLGSGATGLYFILSVVRNLKAGRFLKNALIYIVISSIWRSFKDFYHGGSVMKKVVLLTLAVCVLSATVVLAPVAGILILVFAPKWVRKYEAVKKGVEEVKNGNLTYKITISGDGELDELAKGINQISEASNLAVQNELKNQRLKTDLISNVSHDLKTPLTSIITYIDLLKQEGLDSPDAPKYLEILDQKSIRLKKLTEDLFDAAKASSGAIPVKFETVEMLSLINQGLGEMNDRIEASGLEFKINAQKEKYYVRADGQLLWRVVENLLNNVLKYAQEGSRVYIDLREQNGKTGKMQNVILEIKNISRTALNIDADELMERFKRGDESRTTEGSGLGLAIAKDLVRLQNGWFEIKIDGDLFKAIVMLETGAEQFSDLEFQNT